MVDDGLYRNKMAIGAVYRSKLVEGLVPEFNLHPVECHNTVIAGKAMNIGDQLS